MGSCEMTWIGGFLTEGGIPHQVGFGLGMFFVVWVVFDGRLTGSLRVRFVKFVINND